MIFDWLCRVHRIPAFDYNRPNATGVLVAAGTGLMMALMDQHPSIAWCVDVDILTLDEKERLRDWLPCIANVRSFVAVAGWFSATSPLPLARAVERVDRRKLDCYVQFHGKGPDHFAELRTAHTLDELCRQIAARAF